MFFNVAVRLLKVLKFKPDTAQCSTLRVRRNRVRDFYIMFKTPYHVLRENASEAKILQHMATSWLNQILHWVFLLYGESFSFGIRFHSDFIKWGLLYQRKFLVKHIFMSTSVLSWTAGQKDHSLLYPFQIFIAVLELCFVQLTLSITTHLDWRLQRFEKNKTVNISSGDQGSK